MSVTGTDRMAIAYTTAVSNNSRSNKMKHNNFVSDLICKNNTGRYVLLLMKPAARKTCHGNIVT